MDKILHEHAVPGWERWKEPDFLGDLIEYVYIYKMYIAGR
jgi:hypothetical protein